MNTKIFKNTIYLYVRQLFVMAANLYIVRILLDLLGIDGYAMYSVVAGLVAMGAFFSAAMSSATQRNLSFALGRVDRQQFIQYFTVNLSIYFAALLILMAFLSTLGWRFLTEHLVVPAGLQDSVSTLYICSSAAFLLSILSSAFIANIIANEDMHIYSAVSTTDVVMKLVAALSLSNVETGKLEFYSYCLLAISALTLLLYVSISFWRYENCRISFSLWDKNYFMRSLSFAGWTLFGQLTTMFRTHGITIILNQNYSPVVVVARSIASSVSNQALIFANNFCQSLAPPIVKKYAIGDFDGMYFSVFFGTKVSFLLMWFLAVPSFIYIELLLDSWLIDYPVVAVDYARLSIVEVLITVVALPTMAAGRAPGKIKYFEIVLGLIQVVSVLVSLALVLNGFRAVVVLYVSIVTNILMFFVRLIIVSKLTGMLNSEYYKRSLRPIFFVALLSGVLAYLIWRVVGDGLFDVIVFCAFFWLFSVALFYNFGLELNERLIAKAWVCRQLDKWRF